MDELILLQIVRSDLRSNEMQWSTFGVRRSKVMVTWSQNNNSDADCEELLLAVGYLFSIRHSSQKLMLRQHCSVLFSCSCSTELHCQKHMINADD